MTSIAISSLPAATTITGTELVPVVQGGNTVKATAAQIIASKVTSVTASAPLASSGGVNPNISLTGTVAVVNGGTGLASFTANQVFYASSTSVMAQSSALTFDGAQIGVNGVTVGRGGGAIASNTASGSSALAANTTGFNNTANGAGALQSNTTGGGNAASGFQALLSNTTGGNNTANGAAALQANTTGVSNTAVGVIALQANTTGGSNTAIGAFALNANTTGGNNTAIGTNALLLNTTGGNNTASGREAGFNNTTGTGNTFVGYQAGSAVTTGSNLTVIGNTASASAVGVNNEFTLGNSSIATLRCQVTTITALSDARDKTDIAPLAAGLGFVSLLKPVSFVWNMRDGGKVGVSDTGFIAQDLQQAQEAAQVHIPGLVYEASPDRLEAGYGKLLPILVKAIQELKAELDSVKVELATLKGN